ncbi:Hypothetical predicted protein [Paramuricea clavata]|uniref:Uncharacterized protein n=1 Tax=Paramuricea clavata TaxID=317549 RepID=A0A6S7HE94_PARCT|nr:Hypothetical predicted protein [Paramuricea clavata]
MSRYSSKDNLPFLRQMHDVFLDNERRSKKEANTREKEVRQKAREEARGWEKSIGKEEARRRGVIIRERAAEKKRVREEKKQAGREKIRLRDLGETIIQRERRLRRNERERTRRRKKREAEVRYLELTPIQEASAIRGMVEKYRIEPRTAFDVLTFMELVKPRVRELLDGLRGNRSRNIRFVDDLVAKVRKFFRNTHDPLPMEEMTEDFKKSHQSETRCYTCHREFVGESDDIPEKGVYPYEYMDCHEKLDRSRLPPKRFFYNGLKMEDVTDEEYERAKKVWKTFGMKSMLDYHNLYLVTDTLILSDVIENFRKESRVTYGLDSPWYYTAPGLSWDAALKKTRIKLELITNPRMYAFIENGIRGGISTSVMRYGTADNKYVDISEIPEGIINLMRDLNLKIRKDPTDIHEKVLEFENDVCKFLWDYSQEDDDKIMRYIEKNLTRWVTCLSDHGKEDGSIDPEDLASKIQVNFKSSIRVDIRGIITLKDNHVEKEEEDSPRQIFNFIQIINLDSRSQQD